MRITLSTTRIPIRLGMRGSPRPWLGVAHGLPQWANLDDGTASPEDSAALRARDKSDPQFEWVEAVRMFDAATGITFEVVPSDGLAPRHYSETATRGELPGDPPSLSRIWLNDRARQFLDSHRGQYVDFDGEQRPTFADTDLGEGTKPRPHDSELVALVRGAYRAGQSPRQTLPREFGITPNTADDWIRLARRIAEAEGNPLPRPTRGRGHKRAVPSTEGTNR